MPHRLPPSVLVLAALAFSSGPATADFHPTVTEGVIDARLHGLWETRGYGWVLSIGDDGAVRFFDASVETCIEDDEVTPADFARFARLFDLRDGVLHLTDQPANSTVYALDRIQALPAACGQEPETTPTAVFRHAVRLMSDHYVFFEERGIDWPARVAALEPKVRDDLSEAELFTLFEQLLEGIDDGHLRLTAEIDGERQRIRPGRPAVGPMLDRAFAAQKRFKDEGRFQQSWFESQLEQVRKKLLKRTHEATEDGRVTWGRVGRIGYLSILGMGGFASGDDATVDDEIAGVHRVLSRALSDLADTDALVLDITLNGGGMDRISLAIASHFAHAETLAFTKRAGDTKNSQPQPFHFAPAKGTRYLKPVTLLTSNYTVSAAEIFTMAMRALPQVTHRGEPTRGALSDVLDKDLANGWNLTLSNEIYLDSEGKLWEGPGIAPQEEAPVFVAETIRESRRRAIEAALAATEKRLANEDR